MNNHLVVVRWLRRALTLSMFLTAGWVGGTSAARVVEHGVRVDPTFALEPATANVPPAQSDSFAIASRNLFAALREPVVGGPPGGAGALTCALSASRPAGVCSAWQLRGTIVDGERPAWSAAVVFEAMSKRTRVVTLGAIDGDTEVCEIRPGALLVRRGDQFELCTADTPAQPRVAVLQPAATMTGLQQLASGEYQITRGELDAVRADFHNVVKGVRLVPVPGGFKVFSIQRGSIFARLGLKNGDVLTTVNGEELSSPGSLVGLYGHLDTIEEVTVDLTRRGRTNTLRYRIVE